jgi:methyl-accepting chemotaxis protein
MTNAKNQTTSSSPLEVIVTPRFWKNNYRFFLIFIVCLVIGWIMGPYMLGGKQGYWVALSGLTLAICFYGIGWSLYEISKTEIENSLIESINEKATFYNSRSKQVELDELRNEISPPNNTRPTPAMIRLIEHVVNEAKISRFDSSISLLQPYRDESTDILFKLQHYQKLVLWIGIGGTFVGILEAISSEKLTGLLDKSPKEFGGILTIMFDNLSISFRASLAGLVAAIILSWFILLVKKKQENYFKNMESVVTLILTAARKSKNKDKYVHEIEALKDDINNSQILTKNLQRAIYEMQQQIILQNGHLQESVNKFFDTNERLIQMIAKTEREVASTYNAIALKTTLQEGMREASKQLSEAISPQITTLTTQMNSFRESATSIKENVRKHSEQTVNLSTSINSRIKELTNILRNLKFPQSFLNNLLDKIFSR